MTAESDVTTLGQTASSKSVSREKVRGEGMRIDDFDGAVVRATLSSSGLELCLPGIGVPPSLG
ncbi:MAG TPA: hypothetical protein VJT72_09990 [Pseudonocardiaceae bacterium]|nr:hypothetical protein [Pseudonocardiaceae bacterium]